MTQLTHFDGQGASRMVDVSNKEITDRVAVAHAKITMKPETFQLIIDKKDTERGCPGGGEGCWHYGGKADIQPYSDVPSAQLNKRKA